MLAISKPDVMAPCFRDPVCLNQHKIEVRICGFLAVAAKKTRCLCCSDKCLCASVFHFCSRTIQNALNHCDRGKYGLYSNSG